MRFLSRNDPFRIGIAAFVALGLLGGAMLVISVIPLGTSTYRAELSHTGGLRAQEGVQIAGIEVGEVRKVTLAGEHVNVEFTVDQDIRLGRQTTAAVKVGTLLGTHYLAISPAGSGELADDTIGLGRTSVPFNLQDVIDQGTGAIDQIDGEKVAESLSVVADTLRAAEPELAPAFNGIARISELITRRDRQIGELLKASRSISDQFASRTGDLTALMKQSNLVIDELVRRRKAIRDLLRDVASITSSINRILDDNADELEPMLEDLDAVVGVLTSRDEELREALHKLAVTSRYFANATGDGPFINLLLKDNIPDKVRCGPTGGC
jgi:phospholipid/cholesterol/gamma-HCH transport system substrate-binding protein